MDEGIPDWPVVRIHLSASDAGTVSINGAVTPVHGQTLEEVRDRARVLVATRAAAAVGRRVRVQAIDPDGQEWWISIDPTGAVGVADPPAAVSREDSGDRISPIRAGGGPSGHGTPSRTVVMCNPRGGSGRTTGTLLLARALTRSGLGRVLAWDTTDAMGTLALRTRGGRDEGTAATLLADLEVLGGDVDALDLDRHVGTQLPDPFDVLAAPPAALGVPQLARLQGALAEVYDVVVIDTGGAVDDVLASVLASADQLVVPVTVREDSAQSAVMLLDLLRDLGHDRLVDGAVVAITRQMPKPNRALEQRILAHFAARPGAAVPVPFDPVLAEGGYLDDVGAATLAAWGAVADAVVRGMAGG